MGTDPKYGRRDFLKDSLFSVAKTAQEFAKQKDASTVQTRPPFRADWLRPPGAVEEVDFLERCTRCGDCTKACQPGAIVAHAQDGTPVIFADQSPCVLCADFPCIVACPTKALLSVDAVGEVRMGIAAISQQLCTAGDGCHACVSKCPTNALAMDIESLRLAITTEVCVGCGMCEMVCKTVNDHVAIRIVPSRQL